MIKSLVHRWAFTELLWISSRGKIRSQECSSNTWNVLQLFVYNTNKIKSQLSMKLHLTKMVKGIKQRIKLFSSKPKLKMVFCQISNVDAAKSGVGQFLLFISQVNLRSVLFLKDDMAIIAVRVPPPLSCWAIWCGWVTDPHNQLLLRETSCWTTQGWTFVFVF